MEFLRSASLFCTGMLATTAHATTTLDLVDDHTVVVTRSSSKGFPAGVLIHRICIKRDMQPPGRLFVVLTSESPQINLPIAVEPMLGGEECFTLAMDRKETARFEILIGEKMSSGPPLHSFYAGKIMQIQEKPHPVR